MEGEVRRSAKSTKRGLHAEAPGHVRRGSLGRGRAVITLAALHLLEHDAVEEHGQFGGANLQARWPIAGRHREAKDSCFKSLIPQAPAVLLPGEDLEAIPCAVAED